MQTTVPQATQVSGTVAPDDEKFRLFETLSPDIAKPGAKYETYVQTRCTLATRRTGYNTSEQYVSISWLSQPKQPPRIVCQNSRLETLLNLQPLDQYQ